LLQELNESRIYALKQIWNEYVDLELNVLRDSKTHLDLSCQTIKKIDAHTDAQLFIKYNEKSWKDPPDFVFESSPTFADTLPNLISAIEEKRKQIIGLKSLKEAYGNNPKLGDFDAVTDVRETDGRSHNFKNAAFTIPTTCDLCQNTIWGIAKQGFTCKGELNRGTITSRTSSTIVSPWGTMSGKKGARKRVIGETLSSSTDELSVTTGDVITVIEPDGNECNLALHNGQDGLVPASYIEYQTLDSNDY
ncbi:16310_t:CDS:2, partial [Racocetra fulgida]